MKIDSMDAVLNPSARSAALNGRNEPAPQNETADTKGVENSKEKISVEFLDKAINKANSTMKAQNRYMVFRVHEKTKDIMVKVIDSETHEVVREIPPEKLLDMFANMLEMAGLIVDERR